MKSKVVVWYPKLWCDTFFQYENKAKGRIFQTFQACSLIPSGLQKRPHMAIMSKFETLSKVSLKLTSRINLGRGDARSNLSALDTARKPPLPPESGNIYPQTNKDP